MSNDFGLNTISFFHLLAKQRRLASAKKNSQDCTCKDEVKSNWLHSFADMFTCSTVYMNSTVIVIVIVIEWIALIIMSGNKNRPCYSLKCIMGNQDNIARKPKVCWEFQIKTLLYRILSSSSQLRWIIGLGTVIIYSLEVLKYSFFCLHTFSLILCPWNYIL